MHAMGITTYVYRRTLALEQKKNHSIMTRLISNGFVNINAGMIVIFDFSQYFFFLYIL